MCRLDWVVVFIPYSLNWLEEKDENISKKGVNYLRYIVNSVMGKLGVPLNKKGGILAKFLAILWFHSTSFFFSGRFRPYGYKGPPGTQNMTMVFGGLKFLKISI